MVLYPKGITCGIILGENLLFFSVILGEDPFALKLQELRDSPRENDKATGTVLEILSPSISISHFLQVYAIARFSVVLRE